MLSLDVAGEAYFSGEGPVGRGPWKSTPAGQGEMGYRDSQAAPQPFRVRAGFNPDAFGTQEPSLGNGESYQMDSNECCVSPELRCAVWDPRKVFLISCFCFLFHYGRAGKRLLRCSKVSAVYGLFSVQQGVGDLSVD